MKLKSVLGTALMAGFTLQVMAADAPPSLALTITPSMNEHTVADVAISLTQQAPDVAAGESLLTMPIELVSTPTAAYSATDIIARDAKGILAISSEELPADPSGQYRRYYASRATVGDVTYEYHTAPRAADASTRNGPLFDLRAQQQGMMGAGVYFLALPADHQPYSVTLSWDLSHMPKGSRGVWSYGEGEQHTVMPAEALRFSYYSAGMLTQWPSDDSDFSMYWLDKPPFDMSQLAPQTEKFYRYMANFFGDKRDYRVFARSNPYPAGGGTGLAHSFMFGYGSEGQTIAEGVQLLLAHEMAHTWPRLNSDEPHAETAWYTEGTAEYYAILNSLRAGIASPDEWLRQINLRASAYYANPYVKMTNHEAGELFWKDARAQKVPYGRGFMYLFELNQQLLQASDGKRRLDDLVLEVYQRQQQGEIIGNLEWQQILKRELGEKAVSSFTAMTQGALQVPSANAFGCLEAKATQYRPFDLGFDEMRLGEVFKLREDSEAAKAGLLNGDKILHLTPLTELKADGSKKMAITVSRGQQTLSFSFLPRGPLVAGWQWQFNAQGPAACHFE
ncbi:hypothetical protein HR45_15685 [Shewanella mangrovi]|uniref:Peptidase M61 catalytic domain-containing protein n=1 Tax=Shewanella mangrovi TaxID=1515746 RepID=A0A094LN65_9GAMM|nr:hypothetical protein [Shewanella mangrovi]KFZ36573.1 hypothetical protein HR45_15685 [Shewanella mangrovi]